MENRENVLISVIVPVFNSIRYLPKCLNSLLEQTYKNCEFIIVDDGSTDNSEDVIREFSLKDNRFQYYRKDRNEGLSSARNYGLRVAKGEFISFLDSDDSFSPNFLEDLLSYSVINDLDICVSSIIRLDNKRQTDDLGPSVATIFSQEHFLSVILGLRDAEKYSVSGGFVCNKIFKKKLLQGRYFSSDPGSEDELFLSTLLFDVKKVGYVPVSKYYYWIREGSLSRRNNFFIAFLSSRLRLCQQNEHNKYYKFYLAALVQAILEQFILNIVRRNSELLTLSAYRQYIKSVDYIERNKNYLSSAENMLTKRNQIFYKTINIIPLLYRWFLLPLGEYVRKCNNNTKDIN